MSRYNDLMIKRVTWYDRTGFEPVEIHDWLFEHQKKLVDYALRKGRAALFADTGLGKTAMELSWSDNVARHTNGQVLLVTPLAVARQIEDEAVRFGIDAAISRTGKMGVRRASPGGRRSLPSGPWRRALDRAEFAESAELNQSLIESFAKNR